MKKEKAIATEAMNNVANNNEVSNQASNNVSSEARVAKLITLCHQKGGVGKSVICCILATELHKRGYKVAVIDADIQYSIYLNRRQAEDADVNTPFPIVKYKGMEEMSDFINDNISEYDYILVDTAGAITDDLKLIMQNSDVMIVPITPGATDWVSLQTFLGVIANVRDENSVVLGLYNKVKSTKRWFSMIQETPLMLKEYGVELPSMRGPNGGLMYAQLGDRDEYQNLDTVNAISSTTQNRKIKHEIPALMDAIMKHL